MGRGRVDREFEEWVLWELPLTRALQYYHATLRYAGQWTIPVDPINKEKKLEAAQAAIARITEAEAPADDDLF